MIETELTLPILVGAAVIDSINPCAFGVLIFLIAYLFKSFHSRGKVLLHGLTYIAAVFLTYLVAGLLLLPLLQQLGRVAVGTYLTIAVLLVFFGLLEIKDFFWYGRGPSLAIIPSAARRIDWYIRHISGKLTTSFLLGVFVALVELPCTGAVYLGVIALISLAGIQVNTIALLVLYNIIFVLPLIVILFFIHHASQTDRFEQWREKYRRHMRLAAGLLLLGMGAWMFTLVL